MHKFVVFSVSYTNHWKKERKRKRKQSNIFAIIPKNKKWKQKIRNKTNEP